MIGVGIGLTQTAIRRRMLAAGGGGATIKIAFLGDPQIGSGTGVEAADVLRYRQQTQYLNTLGLDAAVYLGDLINNDDGGSTGARAAWQHAAYVFCRREIEYTDYPIIGNHDVFNGASGSGTTNLTAWLADNGRGEDSGMPADGRANLGCYVRTIGNVRLILWNSDPTHAASQQPLKYSNGEHDTNMAWLETAMSDAGTWKAGSSGRHVVLCLHHRLFITAEDEASNAQNIPLTLASVTYTTPRADIISWIRANGVKWTMSGHTALNNFTEVDESSMGAGDGFTMTETTGSSILSGAAVHALRILTFSGSDVIHDFIELSSLDAFGGRRSGPYQDAVKTTADHFWRLGENRGPAVIDDMGTDIGDTRLAHVGSPGVGEDSLTTSGSDDTAMDFSTGYILSAGDSFPPHTGSHSWECLLSWSDDASFHGLVQFGVLAAPGGNSGITLRVTDSGVLQWNVADGSGNRITLQAGTLVEDQVHHVIAVYDSTENEIRMYLDGNPVAAPVTCTGFTQSANAVMQIGGANGATFQWDGLMDEVSFHPVALSDAQASARAALALAS